MLTRSALTLVDAIAEDARHVGLLAADDALRAQAALVRTLVHELAHHHPSGRRVVALHGQIGDELKRLAEIVPTRRPPVGPVAPPSADLPIDVLRVGDDEPTERATAFVVRQLGFPCRSALSGEEALERYRRRPAAIVVSDWHLRGANGLDLCRAVKERDHRAYVLLVTAHCDDAELLEAVTRGVDDFLPKPVDVDELAARLRVAERLVRGVRLLEDIERGLHPPAAIAKA